jgi:RNase H-fold protein (predicted Holliday junction resolvase)
MATDQILLLAFGLSAVALIFILFYVTSSIRKLTEATKAVEETKIHFDALKKETENAVAVASVAEKISSEAKEQAEQDFFELLKVIAPLLIAVKGADENETFKQALTRLKSIGVPINSSDDENDVRTFFRVLKEFVHTQSEPDGLEQFRKRLADLKSQELLPLSEGGKSDMRKLFEPLKLRQSSNNFAQFVEVAEDQLLSG